MRKYPKKSRVKSYSLIILQQAGLLKNNSLGSHLHTFICNLECVLILNTIVTHKENSLELAVHTEDLGAFVLNFLSHIGIYIGYHFEVKECFCIEIQGNNSSMEGF